MSITPSDLAFLQTVPLLRRFTSEDLRRFSTYLEAREYEVGQVIIWESQPQRQLGIMARGVAVVTKNIRGDVESVLARLGPGAHFGELSLLSEEPASCNVTAEEASRVLSVDYSTLKTLFERDNSLFAKLSWAMLRDLAAKLRATNRKVQEAVEWGLDAASLDP